MKKWHIKAVSESYSIFASVINCKALLNCNYYNTSKFLLLNDSDQKVGGKERRDNNTL